MMIDALTGSFGIAGDGRADDGPALQRALDYAASVGGDVRLLGVTCRVAISDSAPALRLHGGVTLVGDGARHMRIVGDGVAGALIGVTDSGGVRGVMLDGPTTPQSSTIGVLHSGTGDVSLDSVGTAHWTHAVKSDGGGGLDLHDCDLRAASVCALVIDAAGARLHVTGGTMAVDWTGMLTSLEGGAAAVDPQHCIYVGESVDLLVDGGRYLGANDACIKVLRNRGDQVVLRAASYVTINGAILHLRNGRPSYTVGVRSSASTRTVLNDVTIIGEHDACVGIQLNGDVEANNVRFVDGQLSGQWYCLVEQVGDGTLDMRGGSADVTCGVALWWQQAPTVKPWRMSAFDARMRAASLGKAWLTPSGVMHFDDTRIVAEGCDNMAEQGGGELHARKSTFTSATRGARVTASVARLEDVEWSSAQDAGLALTCPDARGARVTFSGQQATWPVLGVL